MHISCHRNPFHREGKKSLKRWVGLSQLASPFFSFVEPPTSSFLWDVFTLELTKCLSGTKAVAFGPKAKFKAVN